MRFCSCADYKIQIVDVVKETKFVVSPKFRSKGIALAPSKDTLAFGLQVQHKDG